MSEMLLDMRDITKSFPGVRALKGVAFNCIKGEVHALVGENGAGKSTLMKVLAGAYQPDSGAILLRGQPVELRDPHVAQELGISTIYQEFNLLPYMSVAENITLGREPHGRLGRLYVGERDGMAQDALAPLDARIDVRQPVYRLSVAQQQLVEIAKALSRNAELIIMDEPSAALTGTELERLLEIIAALKARGVTVIYVSHRLEEIFRIADRVTVLRDGANVGTLPVAEASEAQIIRMMVGRDLGQMFPPRGQPPGEVVLDVRGLTTADGHVQDASLQLRAGEIVGIAGLVGSGRTELARAIFGADPVARGEVVLRGQRLTHASPARSIASGLGFVTEDRKAEGLVLGLSVRENVALPSLDERQRAGFVRDDLERAVAAASIADLQIRTPSADQPVQYLSGGNQQKTVLAKWLAIGRSEDGGAQRPRAENGRGPAVILFDEPTRGIDVGAKAEIYALMRELANQGKAILMISSELPEVLGMSDRVLVMRDGHLVGELPAGEATEEKVMTLATGSVERRVSGVERKRTEPALRAPRFTLNASVAVYAVLALVILIGLIAAPPFRNPGNLFTVLRQAMALGIVSIGQTIIVLAGGIDLSVSSIVTLTSLFSAGLIQGQVGLILPVVLLCLGIGVAFGLLNGWTWVRLGVEPFIVTLGTLSIGRGIALVYARGPTGSVPPLYSQFAYADIGPVPFIVIFFAVVFALSLFMLHRTAFGRHLYATGGNPEVARLAGIAVQRVRLWAFVLSGLAAAVAGLYMSSRMGSGDPNLEGRFELDSITAVVVGGTALGGGRGSLVGTLGGVLLIAVLSNLLNLMNVDNWYQQIIKGGILLIAVATYRQRGG
jgi:ABC-type sugar transport system ATPase subunit/ribose/xylose/arabinose/galactoside ABC-type transport system permease subunit